MSATTSPGILSADAKLTVSEAVELAARYTRYALDRLPLEPRHLHRGVHTHLGAASCQLRAAVELVRPCHDDPVIELPATHMLSGAQRVSGGQA